MWGVHYVVALVRSVRVPGGRGVGHCVMKRFLKENADNEVYLANVDKITSFLSSMLTNNRRETCADVKQGRYNVEIDSEFTGQLKRITIKVPCPPMS